MRIDEPFPRGKNMSGCPAGCLSPPHLSRLTGLPAPFAVSLHRLPPCPSLGPPPSHPHPVGSQSNLLRGVQCACKCGVAARWVWRVCGRPHETTHTTGQGGPLDLAGLQAGELSECPPSVRSEDGCQDPHRSWCLAVQRVRRPRMASVPNNFFVRWLLAFSASWLADLLLFFSLP